MNILEFDNQPLLAIILHPRKQKIYRAVGCLGEKLDFFSVHWDLKLTATLITKPTN